METQNIASNILLMFSLMTNPNMDPKMKTMVDTSFQAVMEYPEVKNGINVISKEGEKFLLKVSPLTQQQLLYGAYFYPLFVGQISTKPITNLKYTDKSGITIRPEIEYKFRGEQTISSMLIFSKGLE